VRREGRAWLLFGAAAATLLLGLRWVSGAVLDLQRSEDLARVRASQQEDLRLAVARMGAFVEQLLAVEQVRPVYEYQPYFSHETAYTRILGEIGPGEVLTPSPLLAYRSDFIRLHFTVARDRPPASPQIPTGNCLDLAQATVLPDEALARSRAAMEEIAPRLDFDALERRLPRAAPAGEIEQTMRAAKKAKEARSPLATMEPLAPVWVAEPGGRSDLLYLRRVRLGPETALQGFLVDRAWLEGAIDETIRDGGWPKSLRPAPGKPFPYEVLPAPVSPTGVPGVYSFGLAILWLAVLAALGLIALAMRRSLRYGRDRQRFASAVTHELRTPLTTFQLYSEMLARDMVRDEAKRQEYLETLVEKSHSLAAMVENVLSYARLEERGDSARREEIPLSALVARVAPALEGRARAGGFRLEVEREGDAPLSVNVDAVSQVLLNLVDNACKYAQGSTDRRIHLAAAAEGASVRLDVRDHGPGLAAPAARSLFTPFDRGGRDGTDPIPGLGLGLALSRGLARDLGGDLTLEPCPEGGARFRLALPRAARPE
jgi:signal transduction histidine kinase